MTPAICPSPCFCLLVFQIPGGWVRDLSEPTFHHLDLDVAANVSVSPSLQATAWLWCSTYFLLVCFHAPTTLKTATPNTHEHPALLTSRLHGLLCVHYEASSVCSRKKRVYLLKIEHISLLWDVIPLKLLSPFILQIKNVHANRQCNTTI